MSARSLVLLAASLIVGCADTTHDTRSARTISESVVAGRPTTNPLSKGDLGPCAQVLPAEAVQVASREIVAVCEKLDGHPLYLVGYSADDYRGVWAAYTIDRNTVDLNSKSGITRKKDGKAFSRSSEIAREIQPTTKDYENNERGLERGHLAPAGAFKFSLPAYKATFLVTNIAPQHRVLNGNLWGCLEGAIAQNWANKWDLLFVIVGAYAGGGTTIGEGQRKITVPLHFFAVVYRADNKGILAIEVPNNDTVIRDLEKYVTTVEELERRGRMTIPLPVGAKTGKAKLSDWPNNCDLEPAPRT